MPAGKISSPYEACKGMVIVSKDKYLENKAQWDKIENVCKAKILLSTDSGFTSLNPLKEGIEYLSFAQQVANKVILNLEKSRNYAECTASCFKGAKTCVAPKSSEKKTVLCSERKNEVAAGLKVYTRKIRMELALSNDASGIVNVNIRNVLNVNKENFINNNLRDFEIGTPNPVGRTDLTERETKEAMRREARERQAYEDEYKSKGYKNYSDWMSVKLMKRFDEHRDRYRQLIYEEAPIFGVIDSPKQFDSRNDPVWSDEKITEAFLKLADNSKTTQEKVKWSIEKGKLEFSRASGEAVGRWMTSLVPGTKDQNDLLFYIGMRNQVEEVLKNDPALCGIATAMETRLHSKEMQNAGITFAATFIGSSLLKESSAFIFHIGRALTGSEAAGLTGLALGATNISDSFRQFNSAKTEAATLSALGGAEEGKSLRTAAEVANAKEQVEVSLVFATGGWGLGKSLYKSLSGQMAKDLPEISALAKKANLDPAARDLLVNKWLLAKVKSNVKSGILSESDEAKLASNNGREILNSLSLEIEKQNPLFFKNPKNVDFFLKTAAATIKKEKGDPADLGIKAKQLLLHFNTEAMNGSWDPGAQKGLLKVFDSAIEELRLSAKNDPATYAKFSSDRAAQEKIFKNALKRSGVANEASASQMIQCALPK
jgi:hypothetical protein